MSKITIIEGNSNDKDQIRAFLVKGEKGDKGDKGEDGTGTKLSDLENDMDFVTETEVETMINEEVTSRISAMYPIGSMYFTVNNVNPSTFLGGTWEQVAVGQFLVGVGTGTDQNNVEKTFIEGENAGEYEHTLIGNELPKHKHTSKMGFDGTTYRISNFQVKSGSDSRFMLGITNDSSISNTFHELDESGGNNQPHNIVNPSFGLYAWTRTA